MALRLWVNRLFRSNAAYTGEALHSARVLMSRRFVPSYVVRGSSPKSERGTVVDLGLPGPWG